MGQRKEGRSKAAETLRGNFWPFEHESLFRVIFPARFRGVERETQIVFIFEHPTKVLRHHAGQWLEKLNLILLESQYHSWGVPVMYDVYFRDHLLQSSFYDEEVETK